MLKSVVLSKLHVDLRLSMIRLLLVLFIYIDYLGPRNLH